MNIIECKKQDEILRALMLKQEYYEEYHLISEKDYYSKILLISENGKDVALVSLVIDEGSAFINEFIIVDLNPSTNYILKILELIYTYCENYNIESITVETTVEQSAIFKQAKYVVIDNLYIIGSHVLVKMMKKIKK